MRLDQLLEAFLGPPMKMLREDPGLARLMGRIQGEGLMPQVVDRHFREVKTRFLAAMTRTLPHLKPEGLALRLKFTMGAVSQTLLAADAPAAATMGARPHKHPSEVTAQLVALVSGGLQAPVARKERKRMEK